MERVQYEMTLYRDSRGGACLEVQVDGVEVATLTIDGAARVELPHVEVTQSFEGPELEVVEVDR